ncbi:MAG TPA: hypothetical protein VKC60_16245, partial [Opitutaceae bacterium]|nr:hypothetical protein [Opitutaceae bacterium]
MAATIALVLFYGITAKVSDPLELYQGLAIIVFSVLPGLLWAKSGGSDFPVFEVFMLTALNTYALPLLSGHSDIQYYSFQIVTTTGWIVLLFQAAALATFSATTGRPGRSAFWTKEILSKDGQRFLGYAIVLNTLYIFCASYTTWIPYELNSTLRAIFSGIGIVCTFVQSRRWGQNDISQQEKIFFSVNVIVQVILSISSLFLVAG